MRPRTIGAVSAGLLLLGLVTVDGRQAGEPHVEPAVADESTAATERTGLSPRNANYDIDVRLDHAARSPRRRGGTTLRTPKTTVRI